MNRRHDPADLDADDLLAACHDRSIELLRRNLSPHGILAATPGPRAEKRGYAAVFGRDAAICALGMALSGDPLLEREAVTGLHTLAEHQAPNGQIPKFVNAHRREADFWYLGCIDSTLWWLIALAFLDQRSVSSRHAAARTRDDRAAHTNRAATARGTPDGHAVAAHHADSARNARDGRRASTRDAASIRNTPATGPLRRRYAKAIRLALQWLLCQEHQRFYLLQQNEASDWADIMPRSGFVLYTNALWYAVKRLYGLEHIKQTRHYFNGLFHPFSAGLSEYRRARLLNDYVLRKARDRDLYLSFVNFSFFGEEGDVFGNTLAILTGAADRKAHRRTLEALMKARVHEPYPVRVVKRPIRRGSMLWRPYMSRHRQNFAWQYHNGGIWPMVGGFWVAALMACGRRKEAREDLVKLARVCALRNWAFTEWLHGRTFAPRGMPGQSWNAAAFLMAEHIVRTGESLIRFPDQHDQVTD